MRICHVTNGLPGLHHVAGGAEAVCLHMVELARQGGQECAVCCLPTQLEASFPFPVFPVATYLDRVPRRCWHYANAARHIWLPFDRVAARNFAHCLDEWQATIVHFHKFDHLSLSLVKVARARRIPTLWSVYDYWALCPNEILVRRDGTYCEQGQGPHCADCFRPVRRFPRVQRALYACRRRWLVGSLAKVDVIVTLSQASADLLAHHGLPKERISILHQPYAVSQTQPASAQEVDGDLLVFAGWLNEKKGIHLLLEAMPLILAKRPATKLEVLGIPAGDEDRRRIETALAHSKLKESVAVLGRMSGDELLAHLRRAAAIVVPEQWHNMSPVIIVEAMALGRPVVASRVGGIPEFVRDGKTGMLFEMRSPDDLARKVLALLADPQEREEMGAAGRVAALELFDEPIIEQRLHTLYAQLIDQSKERR